ncbi:site-specific integrase [Polaribacter sp.]|nr:site-specific integrase [Polaribacter sp.]MDA9333749.1 site-specific integrase [Polaribacter sp.]
MTITLRFMNKLDRYGRNTIRYDISHTDFQGVKLRKAVSTGIKVLSKDIDVRNWRVKTSSINQKELNVALESCKEKVSIALTKFETKQSTFQQVISYLKGDVDYGSVDKYIETVIKDSKSVQTYNDYRSTLKAFKKHLSIPPKQEVSFQEYSSYELLDKFKRKASESIANTTINSYFAKIRAVLNDAYEKGYIHDKFELKRGLRLPPRPSKKIETITSEEFEKAIEKANDIYEVQALALYLLMFGLRGMYNSDIVALKDAEYKCNDFDKKNPYLNLFNDGNKYIIHRRVKTKNRSNDDLVIRIDDNIPFLINMLKKLFKITHKGENILSNNKLALFDYDLNDLKTHKRIWGRYQKKLIKLLDYNFKTARKTYNTYATELEVSNTVRNILLGHSPQSVNEKHYINRRTIKISEKVQQAHTEILEDFEFERLSQQLYLYMINFLTDKDRVKAEKILKQEISKLK